MKPQETILDDLAKVLPSIWYRGCQIKPEGGQFKALGKYYDDLDGAKAAVDRGYASLINSIKS